MLFFTDLLLAVVFYLLSQKKQEKQEKRRKASGRFLIDNRIERCYRENNMQLFHVIASVERGEAGAEKPAHPGT